MLIVTSPHSGEVIPAEANWLSGIDPIVLLTDVDRFVDQLYQPVCNALNIPFIAMEIHRYVLDLNRLPTDIDASCVVGASSEKNTSYVSGFHWAQTTLGHPLMKEPISQELHQKIRTHYYDAFHERVKAVEKILRQRYGSVRYHIDAHSMPSVGKAAHKDSGQVRPDVVVSDCTGKSSSPEFKDLVIRAYKEQGFNVSYNWPYLGGRMTEQYGKPTENRHTVQVELNRSLYMDEKTKEKSERFDETRSRIGKAIEVIHQSLNPS